MEHPKPEGRTPGGIDEHGPTGPVGKPDERLDGRDYDHEHEWTHYLPQVTDYPDGEYQRLAEENANRQDGSDPEAPPPSTREEYTNLGKGKNVEQHKLGTHWSKYRRLDEVGYYEE